MKKKRKQKPKTLADTFNLPGRHPVNKHRLTFGERSSDWLSRSAGSWTFIIGFFVFLGLWMAANVYAWLGGIWDTYPFILLNLVLSCLAALQAPIILMSQNRADKKDRIRSEYDYSVNRKAEKEIKEMKIQLDRIERRLKSK